MNSLGKCSSSIVSLVKDVDHNYQHSQGLDITAKVHLFLFRLIRQTKLIILRDRKERREKLDHIKVRNDIDW